MSVESIQNTAQVSEQYTIRAKREAQSANQAQESQQAIQTQNLQNETRAAEVDTYDKENPAGVKAEGVYSVSHDESGNLRVDYTPKSEDSESKSETQKSNASAQSENAASAAGTSTTNSDDELEELQREKNEIQQQLNRESDENVKAQLRTQLQNIEAEIIQLKLS